MFYYVSFLRPPPTQAVLHQPISITPQISNDLRTESFPESQDLFYSWVPVVGQPTTTLSLGPSGTKPQKLTTWRSSSAYKAIPVQPPFGVKEGQRWRLVLMSEPKGVGLETPDAVDLNPVGGSTKDVGERPLSVWSMPILFTAKAGGNNKASAGKQETVERVYLLPGRNAPADNQDEGPTKMALIERTSFDLDKKIWDSGIGLSSWLCVLRCRGHETNHPPVNELKTRLFEHKRSRIFELGTGIGVVSISIALLRAEHISPSSGTSLDLVERDISAPTPDNESSCILATDVPSAMPLLEQNIKANERYYASESTTPTPLVLNWEDEELPDEVRKLGGLDVIVMADVCYNTSFFSALTQTLSRLIKLSASSQTASTPPFILLGYKQRDEAERTFWDLALQVAGVRFEKVGEKVGAGGSPVEIWLGRVV